MTRCTRCKKYLRIEYQLNGTKWCPECDPINMVRAGHTAKHACFLEPNQTVQSAKFPETPRISFDGKDFVKFHRDHPMAQFMRVYWRDELAKEHYTLNRTDNLVPKDLAMQWWNAWAEHYWRLVRFEELWKRVPAREQQQSGTISD